MFFLPSHVALIEVLFFFLQPIITILLPLLPQAATVHAPGSASTLLPTTSTPFQELPYLIFPAPWYSSASNPSPPSANSPALPVLVPLLLGPLHNSKSYGQFCLPLHPSAPTTGPHHIQRSTFPGPLLMPPLALPIPLTLLQARTGSRPPLWPIRSHLRCCLSPSGPSGPTSGPVQPPLSSPPLLGGPTAPSGVLHPPAGDLPSQPSSRPSLPPRFRTADPTLTTP